MSMPFKVIATVSQSCSRFLSNQSLELTDKSAEADLLTELGNSQHVVLVGEDEWSAWKLETAKLAEARPQRLSI